MVLNGLGGSKDLLGDVAGIGGRQSKGPGGTNGRYGGIRKVLLVIDT